MSLKLIIIFTNPNSIKWIAYNITQENSILIFVFKCLVHECIDIWVCLLLTSVLHKQHIWFYVKVWHITMSIAIVCKILTHALKKILHPCPRHFKVSKTEQKFLKSFPAGPPLKCSTCSWWYITVCEWCTDHLHEDVIHFQILEQLPKSPYS